MSETRQARQRRKERFPMSAVLTLASWRLRSTWFLLLVITLGMVAAVVIACTIPLLSDVMTTAGLRSTLRATPDSAEMTLNTGTQRISTPIVQAVHDQFNSLFHQYLGSAIQPEQFSLISEDFSFSPPRKNSLLSVYGASMQQAVAHLRPIQGRLARLMNDPSSEIEVMMTPQAAKQLGVHVGSTFGLSVSFITDAAQLQQQVTARLVGLFQVTPQNAAYWHGNDFNRFALTSEGSATLYQYMLLTPDNALLALFDHIHSVYHMDGTFSAAPDGYTLIWYYRLDPSRITINNLNAVIGQFAGIESTTNSLYGSLESGTMFDSNPTYPYLFRVDLSSLLLGTGNAPSILELFRSRIDVARIPVGIFALLSIALILFFVSLMTAILVDRQADTIAILRTRGASRGQIFGVLLLQSACLEIIALVIGLPLAAFTVIALSQHVLPASEMDALNILTSNPLSAMLGTIWYALAVVLVTLLTVSVSLFFAARMDVLSLRRETARSNKLPLWQRLNLDVIAGVVALVGYGLSLYVTGIGNVLSNGAQVLIAAPLSLIAPFFLIVGCLLLFLRIFPLLLRLAARLAARGRGAASMLAFAQIARSPRQSLRLTMLLALAITFTLFTLVYNATEAQHIQEIVNFETGADFSAQLFANGAPLSQVLKQYQSLPGVLSVSAGRIEQGNGGTDDLPMEIQEVDPQSFVRTVIWPAPQAYQHARPLLSELISLLRALGITSRQVASMLTWEQATVYITGLLLGGGFGALLVTSVIPALTFTNLNSNLSNDQFFALQSLLATQIVVPPSLPLMLLILVGIYVIGLAIMVRVTTRSALGQSLRLSED